MICAQFMFAPLVDAAPSLLRNDQQLCRKFRGRRFEVNARNAINQIWSDALANEVNKRGRQPRDSASLLIKSRNGHVER